MATTKRKHQSPLEQAQRRLAKAARQARQPKATLPAEVQTVAERMLALRPGQAEFWAGYLKDGALDSWEGYIPTAGNIPADAVVIA